MARIALKVQRTPHYKLVTFTDAWVGAGVHLNPITIEVVHTSYAHSSHGATLPYCGIISTVYADGTADIELDVSFSPPSNWIVIHTGYTPPHHLEVRKQIVRVEHKRDGLGYLICQGSCGLSFQYAEPPAEGKFVCKGCQLWNNL